MAAMTGRHIGTPDFLYYGFLWLDHAGVDATVRPVLDGLGNATSLSVSTNAVTVAGNLGVSGAITATSIAADGSLLSALNASNVTTGTLALARGGTGATTQAGAANAILPSQTNANGLVLGSNGTHVAWVASGGGGNASLADGNYGDVTVSGNGTAIAINNAAVSTAKVADEAITLAKITNAAAANRLLGRGNSSAGPFENITLGNGLSMTGTTLASQVWSVFGRTGAVAASNGDYTVAQVTGAAPTASPTLTGTVTVPTASAGDSSTNAASTAFVQTALSSFSSNGAAGGAINLLGAYGSMSNASVAGRVYRATDADATWRDNGTSWDLIYPAYVPAANQITLSNWTAANLGTSTVTQVGKSGQGGIVYWDGQKNTGQQLRYYWKALPSSTNYTIYCTLRLTAINAAATQYMFFGTRDSATNKADLIWLIQLSGNAEFQIGAEEWTNDTTFSGQINTSRQLYLGSGGGLVFFRIRDDATNRYWEYSPDQGFTWRTLTSKGRTVFQTPDRMFFGMGTEQNTTNVSGIFYACY